MRTVLLAWAGATVVSGCSTVLLATEVPADAPTVAQLRRGGAALGCRELPSDTFRVYLVCESHGGAVGAMVTGETLGFSCPDLRRKRCRRLVDRLMRVGRPAATSEGATEAR